MVIVSSPSSSSSQSSIEAVSGELYPFNCSNTPVNSLFVDCSHTNASAVEKESNLSVVLNCIEYFPVLHVRLKIGTFKMYLSLLLHDSDCMFSRGSSLSWEQKF